MARPLSVYDLTAHIREILEGSALLQKVWVSGEISNFKAHSSGHYYFTLKDDRASLKSVMWRSRTGLLKFRPYDGMKVLTKGNIGVYERDGAYQFYVDLIEPDGLGSLYVAYEQLKKRLDEEGLFAEHRKRPLPKHPRTVAVLTSPTGAAIRDIITVLRRRYPLAQVLIIPVTVQGADAVPSIVSALHNICAHSDIDVVILGRGGGSIEDLWAFNDEQVARAITQCPYPIVSAIGHETDFTIADFVADMRAPTPSAAAELVVPDIRALESRLLEMRLSLSTSLERKLTSLRQHTDNLSVRLNTNSPRRQLRMLREHATHLHFRLIGSSSLYLTKQRGLLSSYAATLHALSPLKVLARGYSVTQSEDAHVITSCLEVNIGDNLTTTLRHGKIMSVVTGKEHCDAI
ncbi:MAG: exodeoxyribonuclease VII large subunit [Bacillota bacterium]|nr:MAG: exodeoxyribonuclease VII large subunit [Bacillota bacterium]MBS3951318.1 exodeoxyribonuclease VII large subunit [Peptococcaceae bacterium]